MTKTISTIFLLLLSLATNAQGSDSGTITGTLTDKEFQGAPLPYANIVVQGTQKGVTSGPEGNYSLNISPGSYTLVFSYVGYETVQIEDVKVVPGKITRIDTALGAGTNALEEVVITTAIRKNTETALLLEQQQAVAIKESIGAPELAKLGVSDVAGATTRISGVSRTEASGDIFVRGLGDRYLSTTLNGLPIPSDDVSRKNIDLSLFSTDIVESISIRKTYAAETSSDQASGNINITSRELTGNSDLGFSFNTAMNSNVYQPGVFDKFRISRNAAETTAGFYSGGKASTSKLTQQTWTPGNTDMPVDLSYEFQLGKQVSERFELFFTGSQSISFAHHSGVFREFRSNFLTSSFSDAEIFQKNVTTTGLITGEYDLDPDNQLRVVSLFVNRMTDELYEAGRNGEGYVFEESDPADGLSQFVRDQNLEQTQLWVNQLLGEHQTHENNTIHWALGYSLVNSGEPNRIRNEVNFKENVVYFGNTGGFQQRKSSQEIKENDLNFRLDDRWTLLASEQQQLDLSFGGSLRFRNRDFISRFYGLEEVTTHSLSPLSIDMLSGDLTAENLQQGLLKVNDLQPDLYQAELISTASYGSVAYGTGKWHMNVGLRYQQDELQVTYDVGNIPGRKGSSGKTYANFYPALNLRYAINDRNNLRFAASRTLTLPEFKEIAPFEYVSQTGRVTRGNPSLRASDNYNIDLKWEFFPTSGELVSVSAFHKIIENPINMVQDRGSAGVFSYFNSGETARITGLELETTLELLTQQANSGVGLDLTLNASRMWHEQDLKKLTDENGNLIRTFRYNGKKTTGLQGASDWILNGALNLTTGKNNPFHASLVTSYASDKIYALGAPEIQTASDTYYNEAIIEKGHLELGMVLTKTLGDHWSLKLAGKNLLDPEIKRVQNIRPSTTGVEKTETVRSYTKGSAFSVGLSYKF